MKMFTQKKSNTLSLDQLKEQAGYVQDGILLASDSGLRELGMSHLIEAAIADDNLYDLMSLETIWFADWMKFGKIGWRLKRG